ncbi:MAG: caspase family protein, partial [Candidatus Eremiobacteraeota bacterium]|nr:caspase family protein [Candidatus Eremiobacteraeota bacterium]
EIVEWSLTSKRDRLRKNVGLGGADQVLYSQDSSRIYFTTRGTISSWDFMDPDAEFETFASIPRRCEALRADSDGLLALTEGGYLSRYNYSGELKSRLRLGNAALFDLAENLALLTSGGSVTIVDTATARRIGFFSEFNKGQGWVAVDSVGRFDGNEEGFKRLAFDLGNQTYPLSAFFNKYYQPGILKDILEVEVGTRSLPTLSATNVQKPPSVSISEPASGEVIQTRDLKVTVKVEDEGSGVSEVSLFHNGHRLPDSSMKKIDGGYQFEVKAVRGTNDIYASAFTGDRSMEARRARIRVTAPELETRKPRLHLLTVGVDEYKSGLALKFAEDDATAISKTLNSDLYEVGERRNLTNQEATLSGILQAVREISQAAEPQDAFVVYLAGHGTVIAGEYYFLPHDAEVVSDQSLASSSLSAESLAEALRAVPATKQLLVLDSCHSGAAAPILGKAVAARSGLEEIRSQQMLARTSGTFLIAATQAEAFAYEIPELKHGVLTYALLEGLGLIEGEKSKDEVTANGLLQSVSNRVPELSEQYIRERQQVIQYSSGQDFPLTR